MRGDFYQSQTRLTAVYPGQDTFAGLVYCVLGLTGEAGEVANKVKKIMRDQDGIVTDDNVADLISELGDIAWYLARVADELGIPLEVIFSENLAKLAARAQSGTLKGSGDER